MAPTAPLEPAVPPEGTRCRILVDGYNVLFGLGLMQPRDSQRALQRAREALLARFAESSDSAQREGICVVFDALDAPAHLPAEWRYQGISVFFSRGWVSADELLQACIARHAHPRRLSVISSDHAVQRKAIARGAKVFESEAWHEALKDVSATAANDALTSQEPEGRTAPNLTADERDEWLRRFGF